MGARAGLSKTGESRVAGAARRGRLNEIAEKIGKGSAATGGKAACTQKLEWPRRWQLSTSAGFCMA